MPSGYKGSIDIGRLSVYVIKRAFCPVNKLLLEIFPWLLEWNPSGGVALRVTLLHRAALTQSIREYWCYLGQHLSPSRNFIFYSRSPLESRVLLKQPYLLICEPCSESSLGQISKHWGCELDTLGCFHPFSPHAANSGSRWRWSAFRSSRSHPALLHAFSSACMALSRIHQGMC